MINVGIVGYGNLGKGVERALRLQTDMSLVGVFTRREPASLLTEGAPVYHMDELENMVGKIDVCILCGGSAKDLPEQTPALSKLFNTVDSFDTHALIPDHFDKVNKAALENGQVSIISVGWDPGLFSIQRVLFDSVVPQGETETFWGKGVSQGHSDAIRRIEGVADGIQYTIPNDTIIDRLKQGENLTLTTRDKHVRECFVVVKDGANQEAITQEILTMPNYFLDYDTTVHIVSQETLEADHKQGMPHGGKVLRVGESSKDTKQVMEFSLELDSNPEFTASVLVAYARACSRLAEREEYGAKTVFDIPLKDLSPLSNEMLRRDYL